MTHRTSKDSEAVHTEGGRAVEVGLAPAQNASAAPKPKLSPLPATAAPSPAAFVDMTADARAEVCARLALDASDEALRKLDALLNAQDRLAFDGTLHASVTRGFAGHLSEVFGLDALIDAGRARGLNINDLLAQSDTVKLRGLTTLEAGAVQRTFAGTLDPWTVRFRFTTGAQTMGASAMVIGNVIHVDPTTPRFGLRAGTTLPEDLDGDLYQEVLLAHEPTHVWSYQHQGTAYAVRSVTEQLSAMADGGGRGGAYRYTPDRPHFTDYGEEQRAMIVQDYVACERAIARGEARLFVWGAQQWVNAREFLERLSTYLREVRSAGPGQAHGPPLHIPCVGVSASFRQDGAAELIAAQADPLLAEVGRAAVRSLTSEDPATFLLGAAGVAGVVAASIAPREQQAEGAGGGGTALLDQAGVPRGVEVRRGTTSAAARVGYDAGLQNPRLEVSAATAQQLGETRVEAEGSAHVGADGLRRAQGRVSIDAPRADAEVAAGVDYTREDVQRLHGSVRVATDDASVAARVSVDRDEEGFRAGHLDARVDMPNASLFGSADVGRNFSLERATVAAAARVAGIGVGGEVGVTPEGVERAAVQVSTDSPAGKLAARAFTEELHDSPDVGAAVTLTREDLSVGVSGQRDLRTGETRADVTVTVPLGKPK